MDESGQSHVRITQGDMAIYTPEFSARGKTVSMLCVVISRCLTYAPGNLKYYEIITQNGDIFPTCECYLVKINVT